jgi:maltose O-acetyltransferase
MQKTISRINEKFFFWMKNFFILFYSLKFKKFGKNNHIYFPVKIYGKRNVSIGNFCSINAFVHIWGNGGVDIGNNVMIATHVVITSVSHDYNGESLRFSEVILKKVIIEDEVWIGSSAVILPGIKIGVGAVIGAGAVVTKDVPSMAIVVGNPAKVLKYRLI